jgi:hypothetical protein
LRLVQNSTAGDDLVAIENVIIDSQYLIDTGEAHRLADEIFATETGDVVPEADFGFTTWRGTEAIRAGFHSSLARFESCMHVVTNLRIDLDGDRAGARYYVQGWHWVKGEGPAQPRNADFLVLGVMQDRLVRQPDGWRIAHRRLNGVGPDVAVGRLPDFLAGLGAG